MTVLKSSVNTVSGTLPDPTAPPKRAVGDRHTLVVGTTTTEYVVQNISGTLTFVQLVSGPQSTTGFGLPTTSGRADGDLHFDRLSLREYTLVSAAWVTTSGSVNSASSGLPSFTGRINGDRHFDTTAKKDYILTGAGGVSVLDSFDRSSLGSTFETGQTIVTGGTVTDTSNHLFSAPGTGSIGVDLASGTGSVGVDFFRQAGSDGFVLILGATSGNGGGRWRFTHSGTANQLNLIDPSGTTQFVVTDALAHTIGTLQRWELSVVGSTFSIYRNGSLYATGTGSGSSASTYAFAVFNGSNPSTAYFDSFAASTPGTLAWTPTAATGPTSTSGFGLPSTSGRNDGDLHFDRLGLREFVLVLGVWQSTSGPSSTVQSGLPGFAGHIAGDLAFDTSIGKQFTLTGTAGGSTGDDFNGTAGALTGRLSSSGVAWTHASTLVTNNGTAASTDGSKVVPGGNVWGADVNVGSFAQGGSVQCKLLATASAGAQVQLILGMAAASFVGLYVQITSDPTFGQGYGVARIRYVNAAGSGTLIGDANSDNSDHPGLAARSDIYTQFELRLDALGNVSLLRNGAVILTATLTGTQLASLGGYAGFTGLTQHTLDDFAAVATGTLAWTLSESPSEPTSQVASSGSAQSIQDPVTTGITLTRIVLDANTTITLPAPAAASTPQSKRLYVVVIQNGTGGWTRAFATPSGSILWAGGSAPTQTSTANKGDVYEFISDGGGGWIGIVVSQNF
jgi:hypothetical protein